MKAMTKPLHEEKAFCLSCEFKDVSILASALAERHAKLCGHNVTVTKTETYMLRGDEL